MQSRYLPKTLHKVIYSMFDTFPSLTLDIIVYMLIDDLCELFWTINTHAHSVSLSIYAEHNVVQTVHVCTCEEYFTPKDK